MSQNKNAKKGYDKSFITNLITIMVSAIAIAVLIALLVPTLITLNNQNSEIENFNKQIEELKDQIAGIDTTDGITAEELEEALGKIDIPEAGLTEEQVKAIIEAAIAGIDIPEAGLTDEQVKEIITEALKGIDTGLTEEQVKDIIEGALEDIDTGLTKKEVKDIINAALIGIKPGLTEEQIKDIIDEALEGINTGLTEEEIKQLIEEVLAGIEKPEPGLTEEQVKDIITEALEGINPGLTEEQIKDIIEGALEGIDHGLTEDQIKDVITEALEGIDTGLTEEQIKDIIEEILGENVVDIKAAIEAGGYYTLTEDVSIASLNIARGITSSLDLNGYTLTLNGDSQVNGSLTVKNGNIVISRPSNEVSIYMYSGINVGDERVAEGNLNLDKVTVTADRLWNIVNYGNLSFKNSTLVVTGGYGIANSGVAVIENCELVANGEATTQVYTSGGTTSIKNTKLYEGTDFESYYYISPIEAYDRSKVTLDGVTVETANNEYGVFAGTNSAVVLKSGNLEGTILCNGAETTVAIYGGTVNGVAFEDITEDSNIFVGRFFELVKGDGFWQVEYQG